MHLLLCGNQCFQRNTTTVKTGLPANASFRIPNGTHPGQSFGAFPISSLPLSSIGYANPPHRLQQPLPGKDAVGPRLPPTPSQQNGYGAGQKDLSLCGFKPNPRVLGSSPLPKCFFSSGFQSKHPLDPSFPYTAKGRRKETELLRLSVRVASSRLSRGPARCVHVTLLGNARPRVPVVPRGLRQPGTTAELPARGTGRGRHLRSQSGGDGLRLFCSFFLGTRLHLPSDQL